MEDLNAFSVIAHNVLWRKALWSQGHGRINENCYVRLYKSSLCRAEQLVVLYNFVSEVCCIVVGSLYLVISNIWASWWGSRLTNMSILRELGFSWSLTLCHVLSWLWFKLECDGKDQMHFIPCFFPSRSTIFRCEGYVIYTTGIGP